MKPWGDEERPSVLDRIEHVVFGALIAASFVVVVASFFRWATPDAG